MLLTIRILDVSKSRIPHRARPIAARRRSPCTRSRDPNQTRRHKKTSNHPILPNNEPAKKKLPRQTSQKSNLLHFPTKKRNHPIHLTHAHMATANRLAKEPMRASFQNNLAPLRHTLLKLRSASRHERLPTKNRKALRGQKRITTRAKTRSTT